MSEVIGPIRVVKIGTGQEIEGYRQSVSFADRLTKKGELSQTAPTRGMMIYRSKSPYYPINIHLSSFAPYNAEVEEKAQEERNLIERLQREIQEAQARLLKLYEVLLPEEAEL